MFLINLLLLAAVVSAPGASASTSLFFTYRVGYRILSSPEGRRRRLVEPFNATLTLKGSVREYGYFFADVYLGSPPQPASLIVDTGSSTTYVHCIECGSACGTNKRNPPYDPSASGTARVVTCRSPQCACSGSCGCTQGRCTYAVGYVEGSSSSGFLVNDLLELQPALEPSPRNSSTGNSDAGGRLTFGCETREAGLIYSQEADGVLGLAHSPGSAMSQLAAAGATDVFSLCLGGMAGDGALLLGGAPLPPDLVLQYTPLLPDVRDPRFYTIRLVGIGVGGQALQLDKEVFRMGYGTVLDSGTTFVYLPSAAFGAFVAEVEQRALAAGLKKAPGAQEDAVCFAGVPTDNDDATMLTIVFPNMTLQFDQMTSLVLPPMNYLFSTLDRGIYCLGVFDNGGAGTLLGGIAFQDVLVQYDRANRRAGFGLTRCNELVATSSSFESASADAAAAKKSANSTKGLGRRRAA